jgi:ribonuclease-3
MENVALLEESLGYQFKNKELIVEALTHKSYKKNYNNERLEFLGDAVLNLIVGEYLFNKFPEFNEGELSKVRAGLVNEQGFNKLANIINLGQRIYLSPAEERNNGRNKASILSDAFEAIVGAMYLESDLNQIKKIVYKLLENTYSVIDMNSLFYDYKTSLQEITQAEFGVTPEYILEKSFGPDHQKEFEISIWINNKCYGSAIGNSKKTAQQMAAKLALEFLRKENK